MGRAGPWSFLPDRLCRGISETGNTRNATGPLSVQSMTPPITDGESLDEGDSDHGRLGFRSVYHMSEGIVGWQKKGFPLSMSS